MKETTVELYATMADWQRARWARDLHENATQGLRLQAPITEGWSRYRPKEIRVLVRNCDGYSISLTPSQHLVLLAARNSGSERITMTSIARTLGIAVTSVSRALTVLAAFKLVAYDVTRGRFGGITVLSESWADMKARARAALARLRYQRDRAAARAWARFEHKLSVTGYFVTGLDFNVASIEGYERNIEPGMA